MRLTSVVCLVLAFSTAQADELRDRMPKDQLAFVEKIDAHKELQRQAKDEPNDFRRGEAIRKLKESDRALADEFAKKLGAGLNGWVGTHTPAGIHGWIFSVPDFIHLDIAFDGMADGVKDVVKDLGRGDVVAVTITAPGAKAKAIGGAAANATTLGASVGGKTVKSVEKAK